MVKLNLRFSLKNVIVDTVKILLISFASVIVCWSIKGIAIGVIKDKDAFIIGFVISLILYFVLGLVIKVEIISWMYNFLPDAIKRVLKIESK